MSLSVPMGARREAWDMKQGPLYKDKKFTSWSIKRVAEALSEEWGALHPIIEHGVMTTYSSTLTRISFKGEINIAVDIAKDKYPAHDSVEIVLLLRLSPNPNDLSTHVLNTLNLGTFLDALPQVTGQKLFSIKKDEPWEGSVLQATAQRAKPIIETMLTFESCFHLLLDDEYEVDGAKLDSKSLGLTHHLNQVKAYRLAEIYGHLEKLDEAIRAIKDYAESDELSRQRIDKLCVAKSPGGMDWLYTPEIIERLCK